MKTYQIIAARTFRYQHGDKKVEYLPGDVFEFEPGNRAHRDMMQRGELSVEYAPEPAKKTTRRRTKKAT